MKVGVALAISITGYAIRTAGVVVLAAFALPWTLFMLWNERGEERDDKMYKQIYNALLPSSYRPWSWSSKKAPQMGHVEPWPHLQLSLAAMAIAGILALFVSCFFPMVAVIIAGVYGGGLACLIVGSLLESVGEACLIDPCSNLVRHVARHEPLGPQEHSNLSTLVKEMAFYRDHPHIPASSFLPIVSAQRRIGRHFPIAEPAASAPSV